MSSRASRTLYVGNLPGDIREREVEKLFDKYGPIHIDLKVPPRPPGYAFVEFATARDAEDAIQGRDGYDFDGHGHHLRVELAHGGRRHPSQDRYNNYNDVRGRGLSRQTEFRVLITGLPSSASWQDLKDHMRRAGGNVCFSQVFHDGSGTTGIVDYTNYEDMKTAVKKLDDSEFRNAFTRACVHVREYDSSRDFSRSPSHGRSYSRGRKHSRSHSRGRSPSRSSSYGSPNKKVPRRSPIDYRSRTHSQTTSRPRALSRSRSRSRSPLPYLQKQLSKSPKNSNVSRKHIGSKSRSRSRSRSRSKSMSRSLSRSRSLSKSRSVSCGVEIHVES